MPKVPTGGKRATTQDTSTSRRSTNLSICLQAQILTGSTSNFSGNSPVCASKPVDGLRMSPPPSECAPTEKLFTPFTRGVPIQPQCSFFSVLSFTPSEGSEGMPMSIRLRLHKPTSHSFVLKLTVGSVAAETTPLGEAHLVELHASVPPPPASLASGGNYQVPLRLEAIHRKTRKQLGNVVFGTFTYWMTESRMRTTTNPIGNGHVMSSPSADSAGSPPGSALNLRCVSPDSGVSTPALSEHEEQPQRSPTFSTRRKGCIDVILLGDLNEMACGWCDEEVEVGRRLVRFKIEPHGTVARITFAPISPDEYTIGDACVSCIYHKPTDQCYLSSYDLLKIISAIVGVPLETPMKNTLRRNLESFKPWVVGKNRGCTLFFNKITNWTAPEASGIKKDTKLFSWSIFEQALDKIVSAKFGTFNCFHTSPVATISSSPSPPPSESPITPQLVHPQAFYVPTPTSLMDGLKVPNPDGMLSSISNTFFRNLTGAPLSNASSSSLSKASTTPAGNAYMHIKDDPDASSTHSLNTLRYPSPATDECLASQSTSWDMEQYIDETAYADEKPTIIMTPHRPSPGPLLSATSSHSELFAALLDCDAGYGMNRSLKIPS